MSKFEALYSSIDRSVSQIYARWEIYGQLFDSGQANVDLLNKSGSYVFCLLQRLLLDDTILALSRLTDPARTGKYENASIEHLAELAGPHLTTPQKTEVSSLLASLKAHVSNAKVHRDKCIAHSDLEHATGQATPPEVAYSEIEDAMQSLETLMLKLGSNQLRRLGGYAKPVIAFGTDGNKLLNILRKASQSDG